MSMDLDAFKKLGIPEAMLKVIGIEQYEKPTLIQEKSIPLAVAGKDIIAAAATGSGKTLSFAAPIVQNTVPGHGIQALVLTPTRELAEQVAKVIKKFSRFAGLDVVMVYGGVSINPQISALRRADVVVATPGRILDHVQRGTINLGDVHTLVLDEADRMLDMGFIDDVKKIIHECPDHRQTMLFSATITPEVTQLSKRYMHHAQSVAAETQVDPRKLSQVYYEVSDNLKFSLLVHVLKEEHTGLVMVFCNSRRNTDFVARNLGAAGIEAEATHGGLTQDRRSRVLERFHSKNVFVLVCTDVAARGLDIPDVSHVYNYDIPKDSKQYVHRIGRTARAGKEGLAISILSPRDHDNFRRLLRETHVEIKPLALPEFAKVPFSLGARDHGQSTRSFRQHPGGDRQHSGYGHGQRQSYGSHVQGQRSSFGGRWGYGSQRSSYGGRSHSGQRSSYGSRSSSGESTGYGQQRGRGNFGKRQARSDY